MSDDRTVLVSAVVSPTEAGATFLRRTAFLRGGIRESYPGRAVARLPAFGPLKELARAGGQIDRHSILEPECGSQRDVPGAGMVGDQIGDVPAYPVPNRSP